MPLTAEHTFNKLGLPDAGEVFCLQRAAFVAEAQAHNDLSLPPLTQTFEELTAEIENPNTTTWGLRNPSNRLIASIRVLIRDNHPHIAQMNRLMVAPDLQQQGLGRAAMEWAEQTLPASITELRLFTGEHSRRPLRLYTKLGYIEIDRTTLDAGYALVTMAKQHPRNEPATHVVAHATDRTSLLS